MTSVYAGKTLSELDALSMQYYHSKEYAKAVEIWNYILSERRLPDEFTRKRFERNRGFGLQFLETERMQYPAAVIDMLCAHVEQIKTGTLASAIEPCVTMTMTTCKRYETFTQTVNSFLNCCAGDDLRKIKRFIVVDDNSSAIERDLMRALYPFFEFVMKDSSQKGHALSMNMLVTLVETDYWMHIEDDWLFLQPLDYISRALAIFEHESKHGVAQVLFNRNYAELVDETYVSGVGGFSRSLSYGDGGWQTLNYVRHEYCDRQQAMEAFKHRHSNAPCHAYWPHFSLRPSLLSIKAIRRVGEFSPLSCFEHNFAHRFVAQGFSSAFFDTVTAIHVGRLTSDRSSDTVPNAYTLNQTTQFGDQCGVFVQPTTESINSTMFIAIESGSQKRDIDRIAAILSLVRDPSALSKFVYSTNQESSTTEFCNRFPFFTTTLSKRTHSNGFGKDDLWGIMVDSEFALVCADTVPSETNLFGSFSINNLIRIAAQGFMRVSIGASVLAENSSVPPLTLHDVFKGRCGSHRIKPLNYFEQNYVSEQECADNLFNGLALWTRLQSVGMKTATIG